jgi:predicted ArsR family transcriptional regulator
MGGMRGSQWQAIAALVDPVRRSLYEYVRRQDHPVTREEAADAHAISRNLTAFHLDKLVEAHLLTSRYEAPLDQPRGRGRTPKVYEPSTEGVNLSIPQRRYDLVGEILADAVATEPGDAATAARRIAFDRGHELGDEWRRSQPHPIGRHARVRDREQIEAALAALARLGYEPRQGADGAVALANCPFHALAERQRPLVCGINHAFVDGLLHGLAVARLSAELRPRAPYCCVALDPSPGTGQ